MAAGKRRKQITGRWSGTASTFVAVKEGKGVWCQSASCGSASKFYGNISPEAAVLRYALEECGAPKEIVVTPLGPFESKKQVLYLFNVCLKI